MKHLTMKLAMASALAITAGMAGAETKDITIGMQLEPPHLDPTGAAAGAIDSVVYANIYEGLTRFAAAAPSCPRWLKAGRYPTMVLSTPLAFIRA